MSEEKMNALDWEGWVCAYVSIGGPFLNGYLGKVVSEEGNHLVLEHALEYTSVSAQDPRTNQFTRNVNGSPIEFTPISRVELYFVAILRLGGVDKEDLRPFAAARLSAKEKLANMRPTGQRLVQPVSAIPSIVGGMNGPKRIM